MTDSISAAQKTTRARKTTNSKPSIPLSPAPSPAPIQLTLISQTINELTTRIKEIQIEFENLQKELSEAKDRWIKEQKDHVTEITQRNLQEDQNRKIEQESYEYELSRNRKKAQDEFADQKLAWQKELLSRKEEIEQDKKELVELRKRVEDFDRQILQAAQSAQDQLQKELTQKFENDKKLREQEFKSEKEILTLRIENLSGRNSQQSAEIDSLKKALEDASRQLKDIAVRVIDASSPVAKTSHQTEGSIS